MKNSTLRLVVVVLMLAIGYGGYRHYVNLHDPQFVGIPPHENADGTIDYTLAFGATAEHEGDYWIVRLPKDQFVEISSPGESIVGIPNVATYGLRSYYNYTLGIFLEIPSLVPLKKSSTVDERAAIPNIRIDLTGSPAKEQLTESKGFIDDLSKDCEQLGEVEKNVFAYLPHGPVSRHCWFSEAPYKTIIYSIRNDQGIHLANMQCQPSKGGVCQGSMILSTGMHVIFIFDYPSLLPADYSKTFVQLESNLVKATVKVVHVKKGQSYNALEENHDQ